MRWNVEGADPDTGDERVVQVDAEDRAAAERVAREQGLLVAAAYPSTLAGGAAAAAELAAAVVEVRSAPKPVPHAGADGAGPVLSYRGKDSAAKPSRSAASTTPPAAPAPVVSPTVRPIPRYVGLQVASSALMVFALLYYAAAAAVLAATAITLEAQSWVEVLPALVGALTLAMVGGLLQGASAACLALRDIARNSFGR